MHRESARARGEINLARDKQSENRHLDDDSSFFFFFQIIDLQLSEKVKNFFAK